MKTEVHILCFNEAEILGYTLRHYRTFCQTIIIHDAGSTDGSQDIAKMYGATVLPWETEGQLNDELAMALKNTCWKGTDADWVICVDADELLYFPQGAEKTLERYEKMGAAMIKAHGFDMFSEAYPTTDGQIYDEVKMGAPSDKWYAKPVLFSPNRLEESGFGIGAHEAQPTLKEGRSLFVGHNWPKANPPVYLLHFHHGVGPIERIARRLDEKLLRLAPINRRHGWGNLVDGSIHAREKRDLIEPNIVKVIH